MEDNKKYYSISEVAESLQIPSYSLRYIEKNLPKLQVKKIRGRRYYTTQDIDKLKLHIAADSNLNIKNASTLAIVSSDKITKVTQLAFDTTNLETANLSVSPHQASNIHDPSFIQAIDSLLEKFRQLKHSLHIAS